MCRLLSNDGVFGGGDAHRAHDYPGEAMTDREGIFRAREGRRASDNVLRIAIGWTIIGTAFLALVVGLLVGLEGLL
jgi:hypothetical protein